MTNTRIAVKENFDEDDLSDDVDDEVFVRDGKKGILKADKQKGDERPLMAPRRKSKQRQHNSNPEVSSRQPCNIYNCLLPVYFGIATIISIAFLMLLYVFLVDKLPLLVNKFGIWSSSKSYRNDATPATCMNFKLDNIWTRTIPKLMSDSQIKLADVNKDNVEDVLIGISTELDNINNADSLCPKYFDKTRGPCSGGVVAIDGKTGIIIWHRWLRRAVLSLHCNLEITGDFISDCIVTGKGGLLVAISGEDGAIIWERPEKEYEIDLYNVLIIHDIDADNYLDILASYTSEADAFQSHILFLSGGRKGELIQQINLAPKEPLLHAPQMMTDVDGNEVILFITGDLAHPGGIYISPIYDLLKGGDETRIKKIYSHETGILSPPILVDVNLDNRLDIVYIADNKVWVLDGIKYKPLWNVSLYDYVSSAYQITTTSSITPAYFDKDWVPDFLVTFAVGSTYPEFYHSMTLVLNGKNGSPLLKQPIIRSSVPDTVGSITLSNDRRGKDAFIYWTAACQDREDSKDPFAFMPQENRHFWADLCALRFNSTLNLQLFALSQNMDPPGVLLYTAKSHKIDNPVNDALNYIRPANSIERNERIPSYYKMMRPREKEMDPSFSQRMQMENDVSDDKQYDNDNDWKTPTTKYQGNGPMNYDTNDNIPYQSNDYEFIPAPSEKEYGNLRYQRSLYRPSYINMIPKVSASGIIAKSFDGNNLDLILSHYEVKADDDINIIIDKKEECILNGLALSSIPSNKYYGLPPEKIQEKVFNDCLKRGGQKYVNKFPKNKLPNLQMGNLYITRNRISCNCIGKKICNLILPYEKQSYPTYLGKYENSVYKTRSILN